MAHQYLDRYERWMRSAHRSARSRSQRLRMAAKVLRRWPDPASATPEQVTDWLSSLVKHPRDGKDEPATATLATYHSDAHAFFKWLSNPDIGLIPVDPMASSLVERPHPRRGVPKPLSVAERERALDAAHGNMRAWLLLALYAGLRASEIGAFRGEQIDERYIVFHGKGDKESAIPTHERIWRLAERYPRAGWWFPSPAHDGHVSGNSVSILVGRHFRSVGIMSGSIHRARHSFGTTLLQRGANMRKVQEMMRHESLATTQIYTAITDDELRAAINLLP